MKRTKIQKAIIPRNWLFGRLAGIKNNLRSMVMSGGNSLTKEEYDILTKSYLNITSVLLQKKEGSGIIKKQINESKSN